MRIAMIINFSSINEIGFAFNSNCEITVVALHFKLTFPTGGFYNLKGFL